MSFPHAETWFNSSKHDCNELLFKSKLRLHNIYFCTQKFDIFPNRPEFLYKNFAVLAGQFATIPETGEDCSCVDSACGRWRLHDLHYETFCCEIAYAEICEELIVSLLIFFCTAIGLALSCHAVLKVRPQW